MDNEERLKLLLDNVDIKLEGAFKSVDNLKILILEKMRPIDEHISSANVRNDRMTIAEQKIEVLNKNINECVTANHCYNERIMSLEKDVKILNKDFDGIKKSTIWLVLGILSIIITAVLKLVIK